MSKTVLLIEDDPDTLDVISQVVKEGGYKVVAYAQPIPLKAVYTLKPSVILLDHWLGNVDGADYCQRIKAHDKTKDIPVVIVSFIAGLKEIAEKSCADGYITKPFDIDYLLARVKEFSE